MGEKLLKRERLHALKGVRDKRKAATSLLACYAKTLNTCLVSILGYRSSIEAVAGRWRVTGVSEDIRVERQLGKLAGGRTRRRKSGRHVDKLALGHSRRGRGKQKGRQAGKSISIHTNRLVDGKEGKRLGGRWTGTRKTGRQKDWLE